MERSLMPASIKGVAVGRMGREGSRPAVSRDASRAACVSRSYDPGAPSKAVVPPTLLACLAGGGGAGFLPPAGRGAPPSRGQKPGGMGRFISVNIGAIGVTPATGSTWNEDQLYAYA